ncbi:unnamed protein product [Adineta ricciae]|uniref:JmjC domain-containing protein n=1 Tax=Adineta ricciae TaxID=249248 RepID=A0A814M1F0_ADIRI|nr:unnamed protein product [Adineta ricciae]
MYYQRQSIYFYFLTFFIQFVLSVKHVGHLKPFGSSGPFEQIDELNDEFLEPIEFFDTYVSQSRPVVFRRVLNYEPHLSLWNSDANLLEIFSDSKDIVHVETRKKESRQQNILTMTMSEFLQRYQHEELYLVEEVPNLLRHYFVLPKCLQCKPAFETFQVAMFWYSSGNTSSVVHTDDYDNINCVLQGEKQFILVDPHIYEEVASEIIDNPTGSFSSVDVDRVNYENYPSLDHNIHYYQVNLSKGDCLYLPSLWVHQVRSTNRNIAVNYWLNQMRVKNAIVNKKTCTLKKQSQFLTLETIKWPKDLSDIDRLRNFLYDLIDADAIGFKQWTKEFSKELNYNLNSNVDTINLFAELFDTIDANNNGLITLKEVEVATRDGKKLMEVYEILQDIMDIAEGQVNKTEENTLEHEDL